MDQDRLARISAALGSGPSFDVDSYPESLCATSLALLGVTGAAVTMTTGGAPGAFWACGELARGIEDAQVSLGEGPAVDAFEHNVPVLEPDLAVPSTKWPFFRQAALDLGIAAIFAFPLQVGTTNLGVLTFYRDLPGFLSDDELADALVIAEVATQDFLDFAAEGRLPWPSADDHGEQTQVHQATGMVSVQINASMADALARLRAYAFSSQSTIFDVAVEVIDRRLRFD
jgi:GAF domain-containing protein